MDTYLPKPPPSSDMAGWYKNLSSHKHYVWIIETGESIGLVGMAAIGFWGVGSIDMDNADKSTWPKGKVPVKLVMRYKRVSTLVILAMVVHRLSLPFSRK